MVVTIEKLFGDKERTKAEYFPRHHFVLVPLGDAQMSGTSGDQWNGVLNALKGEIRELREEIQKQGEHDRASQERGSASLQRCIDKMEERVVGMEGRLGVMEENLLAILQEVKRVNAS